jgi:hypothetical protein
MILTVSEINRNMGKTRCYELRNIKLHWFPTLTRTALCWNGQMLDFAMIASQ